MKATRYLLVLCGLSSVGGLLPDAARADHRVDWLTVFARDFETLARVMGEVEKALNAHVETLAEERLMARQPDENTKRVRAAIQADLRAEAATQACRSCGATPMIRTSTTSSR
jgi:hypothetical protein